MRASASASQPRRNDSWGTPDKYGLISRMGVPSSMLNASDVQQQAIAAEKLNNCEPNGVWTPWGPGREDAVRPIIAGRGAKQFEPLRAIESPKDDKMRKSLDIGKPKPKFRQDLKTALCLVFRTQPLRNFYILCVGATHKPDRYWRKHDKRYLTSYRDLP